MVEAALAARGEPFVANACDLSGAAGEGGRLALVTGPNMAGKSTFLRQNALIAALAQMGSFVPARRAHIGVVDRLFSRVGAADDLARGRSTFMVEMVETAAILNQATRALAGHSRRDRPRHGDLRRPVDRLGLRRASATRSTAARALFATHFHELTPLAETLPRLFNLTMRVSEWKGALVFLHEVVPARPTAPTASTSPSWPGCPPRWSSGRARCSPSWRRPSTLARRSPASTRCRCFRYEPPAPAGPDPLREALERLDLDELTPREAQAALYELKRFLA